MDRCIDEVVKWDYVSNLFAAFWRFFNWFRFGNGPTHKFSLTIGVFGEFFVEGSLPLFFRNTQSSLMPISYTGRSEWFLIPFLPGAICRKAYGKNGLDTIAGKELEVVSFFRFS
jgi:hypothetical protein